LGRKEMVDEEHLDSSGRQMGQTVGWGMGRGGHDGQMLFTMDS